LWQWRKIQWYLNDLTRSRLLTARGIVAQHIVGDFGRKRTLSRVGSRPGLIVGFNDRE
jgi:hypothetical protein